MTVRTTCKIGACEPFCGLEIDVAGNEITAVRPDPDHPVSRGYACIKGMQIGRIRDDPDRLLHPERRDGDGWQPVSWPAASREIGAKLRAIAARHGPTSIATYWGNAADSTAITLANTFCHGFGSPNSFNVLSLEYTDRGAVAARMFGSENLILQPDADRTAFALLLGTNPVVTQGMTLLQRRPRITSDLKAVRHRGGKLVVVDPRRTETARIASEHVAIRPGTDLFLLLVMLARIVETGAYDAGFVARHCRGFDELGSRLLALDRGRLCEWTGIPRPVTERLADEFAAAESAFATTRVGVQTSWNTTLTEWAVQCLNAITGNVDRAGGVFFNPGAVDVGALIERFAARRNHAPSRIGGYPQIFGGPPAAVLADDVLSDDPGRIRALVVVAGNPVISFPDTAKIERALERLDLLVTVDLYRSDTGAFAHYNLPATTSLEKDSFHFLTSGFEPYPFAEWRRRVVAPRGEARSEWQIFRDLSHAAGVPFLNDPRADRVSRWLALFGLPFGEKQLFRHVLGGSGLSLRKLERSERGVRTGEIRWGEFLAHRLRTASGRIELAPAEFLAALDDALASPPLADDRHPLLLVSGARRAASFNSWTHNLPELASALGGNWVTVHPQDAAAAGVPGGGTIRVCTESGSIELPVRISDVVRPGVVAIHQFFGHRYQSGQNTSRLQPGVNVNFLHDDRTRDRFSGMPVFNGRRCRIEPVFETSTKRSTEPATDTRRTRDGTGDVS